MKKRIIAFALCITAILFMGAVSVYGVATTSMDVNGFEKTMNKGASQTITVQIYPVDSEDTIYYSSSDPSVASISPGGKIDAHKKGKTTITVKAGNVIKTMALKVIVETDNISVKSSYIVLRKGERYDLDAEVTPKEADQKLKYKSSNKKVAEVNSEGRIRAVGDGSASITVSNEDMSVSAAVVVNRRQSGGGVRAAESEGDAGDPLDNIDPDAAAKIHKAKLQGYADEEALKALMETGETLTLKNDVYDITLKGDDIVNCQNPLRGSYAAKYTDEGLQITINDGDPLPGEITVSLGDKYKEKLHYYYIAEKSDGPFSYLGEIRGGNFTVDIPGKYYLTEDKLRRFSVDPMVPVISGAALAFLIAIYIVVRRRYWFW